MAATATAPANEREILEARWSALATGMVERQDDGRTVYVLDNSRDFYRVERVIQRLAVGVYGDHVSDDYRAAVDTLDELAGSVWEFVHRSVVEWAAARLAEDRARQAGKAA